jgi:hypothetical protein
LSAAAAAAAFCPSAMDFNAQAGGTGSRFSRVVIILTGVASLFATLVTVV